MTEISIAPNIEFRDLLKAFIKQKPNPPEPTEFDQGIEIDPTDTISVLGQKGSGKSYFISVLANILSKVVIWDARWERFTKKSKGKISEKAHQFSNEWVVVSSPKEFEKAIMQRKNKIIYHPVPLKRGKRTREDFLNEFDDVCQILFEWGNYTFIVDEADQVCDTWKIGEGFHNLLEYGKHVNVGTIAATRRLQHLNPRIARLSSQLVIFRISGKDFQYLAEFVVEPIEIEKKSDWFNAWKRELTHLEDRYFYVFDGKDLVKYNPLEEELK